MSLDFRTNQIQTNKLIVSSSSGPHRLLVYSISADGTPSNQGNIDTNNFSTSSIGSNVFLYVSGSDEKRTVFGGTVFNSGNIVVSEEKQIKTTNIFINTPSVNDPGSEFTGVGIGLAGWDSVNSRSGSIVMRNHGGTWVPIVSYNAQPEYGLTDAVFGDYTARAQMRGLTAQLSSYQQVSLSPASNYHVYNNVTGSGMVIIGANDNGSIFAPPGMFNVVRAPNWYADGFAADKPAPTLKLYSGLGLGNTAPGIVEIGAAKPNTSSITTAHTYNSVAFFYGDRRMQLNGLDTLNDYSVDSTKSGSIVFHNLSGSLNFADENGILRAIPKTNFFHISSYQTTNVLSSSSQIVSQFYFDKSEIGANVYKLRLVYSVTSSSIAGRVKLYDITGGSYVLLNGASDYLEISTTTPTTALSTQLNLSDFGSIYELEIFSTNTGSYIVLGDAKIVYY